MLVCDIAKTITREGEQARIPCYG